MCVKCVMCVVCGVWCVVCICGANRNEERCTDLTPSLSFFLRYNVGHQDMDDEGSAKDTFGLSPSLKKAITVWLSLSMHTEAGIAHLLGGSAHLEAAGGAEGLASSSASRARLALLRRSDRAVEDLC